MEFKEINIFEINEEIKKGEIVYALDKAFHEVKTINYMQYDKVLEIINKYKDSDVTYSGYRYYFYKVIDDISNDDIFNDDIDKVGE